MLDFKLSDFKLFKFMLLNTKIHDFQMKIPTIINEKSLFFVQKCSFVKITKINEKNEK